MREYVRPVAFIEGFVANSYVAACGHSASDGNGMACINPYHDHHFGYDNYFASVWVEASSTTCTIIVNADSPKTEGYGDIANWWPDKNAYVYSLSGPLQCTEWSIPYARRVPAIAKDQQENSPCYGAYVHDGSFTETVVS